MHLPCVLRELIAATFRSPTSSRARVGEPHVEPCLEERQRRILLAARRDDGRAHVVVVRLVLLVEPHVGLQQPVRVLDHPACRHRAIGDNLRQVRARAGDVCRAELLPWIVLRQKAARAKPLFEGQRGPALPMRRIGARVEPREGVLQLVERRVPREAVAHVGDERIGASGRLRQRGLGPDPIGEVRRCRRVAGPAARRQAERALDVRVPPRAPLADCGVAPDQRVLDP